MTDQTTTATLDDPAVAVPDTPARAPGGLGAAVLDAARGAGSVAGVLVGLVVLGIVLTIADPVFLTWGNISNIVATNSVVLVLAVGATFVIISGGIDLSTAGAAAVAGVCYGLLLRHGQNEAVSILGVLAVGLLLGAVNGGLIAYVRVPFLVVTLGTLSAFSSVGLVLTGGTTINTFSFSAFHPIDSFAHDGAGPVSYLLIFDVLLVAVAAFVLRYTTFGRSVYAVGSNREAARLNGVSVARTTFCVYLLAGLAAAIASLVQVGRLTGASPNVDSTQLLTVIAAVLIGGTAYTGGEGGVGGTALGVLFLGVIQNGLTLGEVSTFWRGTVNGAVLVAAVALGVARDRGWLSSRRRPRAEPLPPSPTASH